MTYLRYPHVHGDLLVFAAEDDIYLAPAGGGRAWRLSDDGAPVGYPKFSRDGAQIAWTSRRDGAPDVYTASTEPSGQPVRRTYWGDPHTRTVGWSAEGEVLAVSAAGQPSRKYPRAFAIGAVPRELAFGQVNDLAIEAEATALLTGAVAREPAYWKRYRGGRAGRLWVRAAGLAEFSRILPEHTAQLGSPMVIGGRLFFLSDHEGTANIYSTGLDGTDLRKHTGHDGYYARNPATDGTRIVYHVAGDIWILDSADAEPRKLDVVLSAPARARAPRLVSAADHLGDLDCDKTGQASVIEVQGTVHWLTHRDGPARALTVELRARLPRILGDKVVWVTDVGGADALEIASPDGDAGLVRLAAGDVGSVCDLAGAPDGSAIAVATMDGRLLTVDGATGQVHEVETTQDGQLTGLAWSADSALLAWSRPERNGDAVPLSRIRIARIEPGGGAGEIIDVTDGRFSDTEPVFTPDGLYLAFLSRRTFDPVYNAHAFDLSFPYGIRPYLVTLAAGTPSPFGPLSGGRPLGDGAGKAEKATTDDSERSAVTLEPAGISSRVVAVPVGEASYSSLRAVSGGLAWLRSPVVGELGDGTANPDGERPRASLERFDLGKREVTVIVDELDWFAVSGDGTRLVVRDGSELRVVPSGEQPNDKESEITVDLSRARLVVDPGALWRHAFAEVGRLVRRDFWRASLSGVDWDRALERYSPLVDRIRGSADFADLLWELQGELGTSHAYVTENDGDLQHRPAVGKLGADISRDDAGRWLIDRVLPGESSDPGARSPLEAPGVVVKVGDEIVAVDGQPVAAQDGPSALLAGAAGKPVELAVRPGPDEPVRRVVVVPLRDERQLRYHDWVAGRRRAVRELGGGRVGYLHVPDMMSPGWAQFHRDLSTEMSHDAVVIDVRGNSGGHTSELIVEQLARRVIAWGVGRYQRPMTYPSVAPRGPVVAVADEFAGSDGDIVTGAIRTLGIGPVVGTRTWGGVIGIDGERKLVDGSAITVPGYAFWFTEFGWGLENHGVDPDVEVFYSPDDYAAGRDPQLETAVRLALEALDREPPAGPPDVP
ncbi:MAG TPA: PDZ domain-containing protein [Trebonia sp.]|nr:PDZ domain-containing protein [Trebonia sp.]